jgi:hypothetical protein
LAVKTQNETKIKQLEKQSEKHQELLASYDNIQTLIQESGSKQEEALTQMIDAVELAEKASAQVRKQYLNRDMYNSELARVQAVVNRTKTEFDQILMDYEREAKRYFEPLIEALEHRIDALKDERQRSMREKDFLVRDIEKLKLNRPILTVDTLIAFKTLIEEKAEQKIPVLKAIAASRQKISDMEMRVNQIGPSRRNESVRLRKRRQELEMQIVFSNRTLSDHISRNAIISEDNERLKQAVTLAKNSAAAQLSNAITDRVRIGSELQVLIHKIEREQQIRVQELEGNIIKAQLMIDECRDTAHQARERAHTEKQNKKSKLEQVRAEAIRLHEIVENNEEELARGQLLLRQTIEQLELLRKKTTETRRSEVRQRRLITELHRRHAIIAIEIENYRSTAQSLADKVAAFADARLPDDSQAAAIGHVRFDPV